MISNREKDFDQKEYLPKCPKYPPPKTSKLDALKDIKAIILILGILISGIGFATINDVQPPGVNNKKVLI